MHPHDAIPPRPADQPPPPALEVRPRMLAAFIAAGLVILVASVFGAFILWSADAEAHRMLESMNRSADLAARLNREMLLLRVTEKNLVIEETPESVESFVERARDSEARVQSLLDELGSTSRAGAASNLEAVRAEIEHYREALHRMIDLARSNTLAQAAELSRTRSRALFDRARASLMKIIERNRDLIAQESGRSPDPALVARRTGVVASAREVLEGLHDLLYLEQSTLTVYSAEERTLAVARIGKRSTEVQAALERLASEAFDADLPDAREAADAFSSWEDVSREIQRLARENSRGRATNLSFTAARNAYLRSADALDRLMQDNERTWSEERQAHARSLAAGRRVMLGTAGAGVVVVILTAWLAVNLVFREYRAAADVLMKA